MMLTLSPRALSGPADDLSLEEASYADRSWPSEIDERAGGLTLVQVREGDGRFLLSAALTNEQTTGATVDLCRDALGLHVGPVVRWVPIPEDALVNEATVQISDGWLTVSMPLRVERKVRHVLHVW